MSTEGRTPEGAELEPRLRAWLVGTAPADVPHALADRVQAIPRVAADGAGAGPRRWPFADGPLAATGPRGPWRLVLVGALVVAAAAAIAVVGAQPAKVNYNGVFVPGPTMDGPRQAHTATLLEDGRVLVAGGYDGGEPGLLASALLYDPAEDGFSPTGSMSAAPDYHAAVRLADGRVLVVGGASEPIAELYDPGTETFAPVDLPHASSEDWTWSGAAPVALVDGRAFLVSSDGREAAVYDPASGSFSTIAIPDVGYGPTVGLLADGHTLLIIAGKVYDANGDWSADGTTSPAWLLDTTTGAVTPTGGLRLATIHALDPDSPAELPRQSMTAVTLHDGRVLVVGGFAKTSGPYPTDLADLYDPRSGRFTPTGSLRVARSAPSVTRLADGRVLVAGGNTWDGEERFSKIPLEPSTDSAEIYDPATGTFVLTGTMVQSRSGHTATLLADGRVLVTGGSLNEGFYQGQETLSTSELFE